MTNVDISDAESGMAKDILFKPRVEATQQMTQHWTFRSPRSESARAQNLHLSDMYVVVISCFHSTLCLKTQFEESSSAAFYDLLSLTVRSSGFETI